MGWVRTVLVTALEDRLVRVALVPLVRLLDRRAAVPPHHQVRDAAPPPVDGRAALAVDGRLTSTPPCMVLLAGEMEGLRYAIVLG